MSQPTIHGFSQSSYVWTARACAAAKGVDVGFQPVVPGQNRQPEHLARHPFGKVPSFQHGDVVLFETSAIVRYLDTAFEGPSLFGEGLLQAAQVEQWISVVNAYLYRPAVLGLIFAYIFPGTEDGSPNVKKAQASAPEVDSVLSIMAERADSAGPWLVGGRASAADYFVGPLLLGIGRTPEGKELLGRYPRLGALVGALTQDAAFMSAVPQ